jgi:hypothetical protein
MDDLQRTQQAEFTLSHAETQPKWAAWYSWVRCDQPGRLQDAAICQRAAYPALNFLALVSVEVSRI